MLYSDAPGIDHALHDLSQRLWIAGNHEGAPCRSLPEFKLPNGFEGAERLPQRMSADGEAGGEFAFVRKFLTGLKTAGMNLLANLSGNRLEQALALNLLDIHDGSIAQWLDQCKGFDRYCRSVFGQGSIDGRLCRPVMGAAFLNLAAPT